MMRPMFVRFECNNCHDNVDRPVKEVEYTDYNGEIDKEVYSLVFNSRVYCPMCELEEEEW